MFEVDLLDGDDILDPISIAHQLDYIDKFKQDGTDADVSILTNGERTVWAANREKLRKLSPNNQHTLQRIESAMWLLVFDDFEPQADRDV